PHSILLVDSWTDQAALDIHHVSPMMQEILDLRSKYQLTVTAERYSSDEDGITEQDKDFLNR
ncbi:antibiotic biosynthesis monooxygenase, partial [Flavobacterium davisii]